MSNLISQFIQPFPSHRVSRNLAESKSVSVQPAFDDQNLYFDDSHEISEGNSVSDSH